VAWYYDIYYASKEYSNSLKYYESAYTLNQNQQTLVKLTNILYSYLNKKDVALAYLETYLQTKGCSAQICNKLMLIYQEQGNIDGMISILNRMYTKYKDNPELEKTTLFIQNLIISLLEKKDIKKAIKFLEETGIDQTKLINLYYRDKQLTKALKLTKKIYKQTRKPELLGKIAMYRFELASDKRKVMPNVIANFELALSSGINNASYQNYYGYLLIDFDIDIKKGLVLVKEALKTAPNNIA
jgi:tetratricopeptide (TPR) repeat protein